MDCNNHGCGVWFVHLSVLRHVVKFSRFHLVLAGDDVSEPFWDNSSISKKYSYNHIINARFSHKVNYGSNMIIV